MQDPETKAQSHEVDSKSDADSASRSASCTDTDGLGSIDVDRLESAYQPNAQQRRSYGLASILLVARRAYACLIGGPGHLAATTTENVAGQWRTSLIRFGPLSGIFALVLMILSLTASLGILAGSDQTAIDRWPTSPSTYIAIFTAIGNLSMRYAAFQGIVVAWWLRALRGSSLTKLHNDWKAGTSIRSAIAAGPQMGWFGLACIFSTLVVVDGPLLQRASNAASAPYQNHPVTLSFSMVPEMPRDYSGQWRRDPHLLQENFFNNTVPLPGGGNASNFILPTIIPGPSMYSEFAVISKWYNDDALSDVVQGCSGTCSAKLVAPALAVTSCSTEVRERDYNKTAPSGPPGYNYIPLDSMAFILGGVLVVDEAKEKLQIATGYSTTAADCKGVFNYTVCTLESAIGEYDVTINDDQLTLDSASSPRILAIANNTAVNHTALDAAGWHPSTLAGVMNLVNDKWALYAFYTKVNGVLQRWQAGETNVALFQSPSVHGNSSCSSYKDPMEQLMGSFNKLMVYFGHAATQNTPSPYTYSTNPLDIGFQTNTTQTGYLIGDHEIYRTNYWYFFGAALAQLICVCLVAPTYWGWWKIGRDVSFSPLEIAKAFEAPILADINSNSSGREIARACHGRHVQYGIDGEKSKLAFADPKDARIPKQCSMFEA